MSFAVRIIPSPDWFVGVDSLDLCDGDHWREQVAVDLHPYDAGTDSGFTFSSPNFATIPQDTVTEVRGQRPRHSPQEAGDGTTHREGQLSGPRSALRLEDLGRCIPVNGVVGGCPLGAAAAQGGQRAGSGSAGPNLLPRRGGHVPCGLLRRGPGAGLRGGPARVCSSPSCWTPRLGPPHAQGQAHTRCSWVLWAVLTPRLLQITASSPNHPANSFFYPRLKALPPIARVTLVQLRQSPRAFVPPALDLAGGGNEIVDSLPGKPGSHHRAHGPPCTSHV